MMSFWRKLIIGNLVCIKTCYSFKPAKPFQWPKTQVQDHDALKSPWLMPQGTLTKNWPFLGNTFEPYFSSRQKWCEQPRTKSQPFQNDPHMKRDVSSWKAIYDMWRCPEETIQKKRKKWVKEKEKLIVMTCIWKIRLSLNENQESKKNVEKMMKKTV